MNYIQQNIGDKATTPILLYFWEATKKSVIKNRRRPAMPVHS